MNKEERRKEVYEIVWSVLTQQLQKYITINEDSEEDKLEDMGEQLEIGKYNSVFSWRLSRKGQCLTINTYNNGNVSIVIEEQLHRSVTINIVYNDYTGKFLNIINKAITDLVHIFLEGNWHILADFLSPAAFRENDWLDQLEQYKKYEAKHPYMCGNITYM